MRFQQRRRPSSNKQLSGRYSPVIGLLNPLASLDCQISPYSQSYNFNIHFEHPLEAITKITCKVKKDVFERLVQSTFDVKIQQKTIFIPEALLTGNSEIIHQYKKLLQKGRVNSYIKLNIRQTEVSREKKKIVSVDERISNDVEIKDSQLKKVYAKKVFNQNTINEKTMKKPTQMSKINTEYNKTDIQNDMMSLRSFSHNQQKQKPNDPNSLKINIQKNDIHSIYHHSHIYHNKKTKKSTKKSTPFDGIKINYIQVKSNNDNPEISTFLYKSTAMKTNQEKSFADKIKTDVFDMNLVNSIEHNIRRNNQLNFSNRVDKTSVQSHTLENNDNFSEHNRKSYKNTQMSEFTHELHTKNYFFNDRKILKKGRKAVDIEQFEKIEV